MCDTAGGYHSINRCSIVLVLVPTPTIDVLSVSQILSNLKAHFYATFSHNVQHFMSLLVRRYLAARVARPGLDLPPTRYVRLL